MNKKGLVLIYNPHNLYEFLWYYCTYGKNKDWDVLCLPHSYMGEYLSPLCKKLNIFQNIYTDNQPFDLLPTSKRLFIFLKMLCYAMIGQQKKFAEKMFNKYVNINDYDTINVLSDGGLLCGMALLFGKQKDVIILEDGANEFVVERKFKNILNNIYHSFVIQGFILAILGYSNISGIFPLRTTKNCIKFSTFPQKLKYKKYKQILTLFDMQNTDVVMFQKQLACIYPNLESYFSDKIDAIIFTSPLMSFTQEYEKYIRKIEEFVNTHFSNILIKKHPRDNAKYVFSKNITCTEIDQSIPAEVLLPYLKNIKILFTYSSTICIFFKSFGYTATFLYYPELHTESKMDKTAIYTYPTQTEFIVNLEKFGFTQENVIVVD